MGLTWQAIHGMNSHTMTRSGSEKPLNPAYYPILAVLSLGPAHGYDVFRLLKEDLGRVWKLGRSKMYALLSQMESDGLVRHERVEQINSPARKVFHMTTEGRRLVEDWIRTPVVHVRDFRLEFPVKHHFARTVSRDASTQLVRDQIAVCLQKRELVMAGMAECRTETERQVIDYRAGVIDATIAWLEGLVTGE